MRSPRCSTWFIQFQYRRSDLAFASLTYLGVVVTNIFKRAREADTPNLPISNEKLQKGLEMFGSHTADSAAEMIINGVEQGISRVLVTPEAHVLDLATRFFPRFVFSNSLFSKAYKGRRDRAANNKQRNDPLLDYHTPRYFLCSFLYVYHGRRRDLCTQNTKHENNRCRARDCPTPGTENYWLATW